MHIGLLVVPDNIVIDTEYADFNCKVAQRWQCYMQSPANTAGYSPESAEEIEISKLKGQKR